jgi:hypothetical protein
VNSVGAIPRENARKSTDYQYVMISFRGKNEGNSRVKRK